MSEPQLTNLLNLPNLEGIKHEMPDAETKEQLKGSRWAWVKNRKDLNEKQRAKLKELYQASPELRVCHPLNEEFRAIFETITDREQAGAALLRWIEQVEEQSVTALRTFLVTLKNRFELIANYFIDRWQTRSPKGSTTKSNGSNGVLLGSPTSTSFAYAFWSSVPQTPLNPKEPIFLGLCLLRILLTNLIVYSRVDLTKKSTLMSF